MPMIRQPVACKYDAKTRRTQLWFDTPEGKAVVAYYMMASVCWPEGDQDGLAILGGQNLLDGRIIIFRELTFLTIDHWLMPDQSLRLHGLVKFFNEIWTDFQCRSMAWSQDKDVHKRYLIEAYACDRIIPKPEFLPVTYSDPKVADRMIDEALRREEIQGDSDSRLFFDLKRYKSLDIDTPGSHALRCLLGAFRQYTLPDISHWPKLTEYYLP